VVNAFLISFKVFLLAKLAQKRIKILYNDQKLLTELFCQPNFHNKLLLKFPQSVNVF